MTAASGAARPRRGRRRYDADPIDAIREDLARIGSVVHRQLDAAITAFDDHDLAFAESIVEKDDLADSLNLKVETQSFDLLASPELDEGQRRAARSAIRVASNLERVGDAATHIAKRVRIMQADGVAPGDFRLRDMATVALQAVDDGLKAVLYEDQGLAIRACEREPELDHLYLEAIRALTDRMRRDPGQIPYCFHVHCAVKYIEKIGDYVLNIGEQAIFLITGRRLKFGQFQQLDSLLPAGDSSGRFSPYLDGISGALVAEVRGKRRTLFKEGARKKIRDEVRKSEEWERIDDSLTPRIISTTTYRDRQALLREFVEGRLLSAIYFEGSDLELKVEATEVLRDTLLRLWEQTIVEEPPELDYVRQISSRLAEVYGLHPYLERLGERTLRMQGRVIEPIDDQLAKAAKIEATLAPPFSIWLHGDLNPNNVVYRGIPGSLKFFDVHRSRHGDYLQDLTVFLVGLERVAGLSATIKRHLRRAGKTMLDAGAEFGAEHGDAHHERRLRLGFGRSYITSARIILQPAHAEWLFRKGRAELQRLIDES